MSREIGSHSPHTPRYTQAGKWVCSGGIRRQGQIGCDFSSPHYHEAVTHATERGGRPPDYPREMVAA